MKAVVVYESLWGNTAAIARAIAEGIGPETQALTTDAANAEALAGADLVVVGSPVIAFSLPTESSLQSLRTSPNRAPSPPDLSHPSMRSWLDALPKGQGYCAAFETGLWWSPGGAKGAIVSRLQAAGYRPAAKERRFVVKGAYGPLRDGELEQARLWGAELARLARESLTAVK